LKWNHIRWDWISRKQWPFPDGNDPGQWERPSPFPGETNELIRTRSELEIRAEANPNEDAKERIDQDSGYSQFDWIVLEQDPSRKGIEPVKWNNLVWRHRNVWMGNGTVSSSSSALSPVGFLFFSLEDMAAVAVGAVAPAAVAVVAIIDIIDII